MILNAARFHSIGKVNDADTHCQPPLMLTTFTTSMVKPMNYYVYGESMEMRAATRLPMRYHIRNTLETYRHICCKMNLVLHVFSSIDTVSLSRCVAPTLLQKRSNIFIAQLDQRLSYRFPARYV